MLKEYLLKVKSRLDKANIITSEYSTSLTEDLGNNRILEAYYTFAIEICNFEIENQRFVGSGKSMLTQMEEVIGYIPQFTKNYHICAYTRSSILLCYHTDEIKEGKLQGLCRQLIQVLKNYMNIKIYIGVSNWNKGEEMLEQSMDTAFLRLSLSYIFGKQQIFLSDTYNDFDVRKLSNQPYLEVIESLRNLDDDKLFEAQSKLFNASAFENEVEMKRKCLELIYFEGMMLNEIGDSIWNVWGEIIDFDEKINRLQGSSSMVMWIANYNRWIIDYLHNKHVKYEEANEMETFCHYIEDNYANSDLSLNEVASIAGFNEKYFSSKFKKEVGVTFVDYLTNVRIEAAKKLLQETNMKLVAISESVGYNNVEHFVRVFKKKVGVSPREYAKSCR